MRKMDMTSKKDMTRTSMLSYGFLSLVSSIKRVRIPRYQVEEILGIITISSISSLFIAGWNIYYPTIGTIINGVASSQFGINIPVIEGIINGLGWMMEITAGLTLGAMTSDLGKSFYYNFISLYPSADYKPLTPQEIKIILENFNKYDNTLMMDEDKVQRVSQQLLSEAV